MIVLYSLLEQRRAPFKLGGESSAPPRSLTPVPLLWAPPLPSALALKRAGLHRETSALCTLAPSLRSCLSGCGTGSQPPPGSPAWLLSQGTQRCYPWGMDLNGGIVPAPSRAGSGRERADTGNVPGATQVGFVLLLLLSLLLPPCPPT